ncbi:hypothetical protein ACFXJ8_16050 [Nonomuraea sp. NPDC059194]|uniref:hypothetical protein n=1 Tax=Nonomuraea sp. NPDC059194 TaxID=3346764 RepID=UPI0036A4A5B0
MRLTWKDAVATTLVCVIVVVYALFLVGADLPVVRHVGGVTSVIVLLGTVAGCEMSRGDLFTRRRSPATLLYIALASALGITALLSSMVALMTASETALTTLVAATVALWLIATVRHAVTRVPPEGRCGFGPRTRGG